MFGLGKKKAGENSDKPVKKTSGKKSSGGSAAWKNWLINHGEKVGLSLFTLFAFYLIYSGLTTPSYERTRTPEVLSSRSLAAKQEIETGKHPIEYPQPNDFRKAVIDARKELDHAPFSFDHLVQKGTRVSGEKRGDPEIFAPVEVQATCFVGSIAVYVEKEKVTTKIDEWFNAPPLGKKRDVPNKSTPPRELNSHFHRGFMYQLGMEPPIPFPPPPAAIPGRLPRTIEYKPVPKLVAFNVVTTVVPHGKMEESYKKELESAVSVFNTDRDSPNYLYYEVQRADVTDNPIRNVDESEWSVATDCMLEQQIKSRTGWTGFCDEVTENTNLVPNVLTMPIPPILLWDYRGMASHPLLSKPSSFQVDNSSTSDSSRTSSSLTSEGDDSDSNEIASAAVDEELAQLSFRLPSSEYKLIRFFDFGIDLRGKIYRYRVRLALEDPNYPRARSLAVSSTNLKSEVLTRVQKLEEDDQAAREKLEPGQKFQRNSKRLTEWSEPSRPVFTQRPVGVYANSVRGTWTPAKTAAGKDTLVESLAPKSTIVHGEWKLDDAIFVTRKIDVERGTVLSGPLSIAEPGLDVIHPITKTIKWLTPYKFTQPITIVDLRGGQPLAAEKRPKEKDPLPSQGEVVSFDPVTGNLIISREFESADAYDMFTFAGDTSSGASEGAGDAQ
jgi:hypothetical protein